MLELPELETLRRELDRDIAGRKVKAAAVADPALLAEGTSANELKKLEGAKVSSVVRRHPVLAVLFDSGDRLVIELGDGSQPLRKTKDGDATFELSFTQGGPLRIVPGKTSPGAKLSLLEEAAFDAAHPVPSGFDTTEQAISWVNFARALVQRGGPLRTLLLDRTVMDGIGPLYADEILWQAGLRPDRRAEKLGTQELRRLYRSVAEVLHEAMKAGGASTDANGFVDLSGKGGGYQDQLEAYGRSGQPCRRCRSTIGVEKFEGKQTFLCAQCQV